MRRDMSTEEHVHSLTGCSPLWHRLCQEMEEAVGLLSYCNLLSCGFSETKSVRRMVLSSEVKGNCAVKRGLAGNLAETLEYAVMLIKIEATEGTEYYQPAILLLH